MSTKPNRRHVKYRDFYDTRTETRVVAFENLDTKDAQVTLSSEHPLQAFYNSLVREAFALDS